MGAILDGTGVGVEEVLVGDQTPGGGLRVS